MPGLPAKRNRGNFSYDVDGKFRCFSCTAKGRGAIALTMQVRQLGFQAATEILRPFDSASAQSGAGHTASAANAGQLYPTTNPPPSSLPPAEA
jgi:hypothetical protein